ncbi:MAG: nitroreductase family protein [Thermoplasmatota archaeon]
MNNKFLCEGFVYIGSNAGVYEMNEPVYEAILSRRSIRRFKQTPIKIEILEQLVNAARLAPSAANLQPLEYVVITDRDICLKIFETLGWAGYITPTWAPDETERPVAYIVILVKTDLNKYYKWDVGLAAENIMLAAEEKELGSCMLLNINREKVQEILKIPSLFSIDSIIALGYKAEISIAGDMKDSVRYYRDEQDVLHVPKRVLKDILHINRY